MSKLQVIGNDVARSIVGKRRADHVPMQELLLAARLPPLNHLVVRGIAAEVWKALKGPKSSLSRLLWDPGAGTRHTRATEAAFLKAPTRLAPSYPCLLWSGYKLWNSHEDLRVCATYGAAKKCARAVAATYPI